MGSHSSRTLTVANNSSKTLTLETGVCKPELIYIRPKSNFYGAPYHGTISINGLEFNVRSCRYQPRQVCPGGICWVYTDNSLTFYDKTDTDNVKIVDSIYNYTKYRIYTGPNICNTESLESLHKSIIDAPWPADTTKWYFLSAKIGVNVKKIIRGSPTKNTYDVYVFAEDLPPFTTVKAIHPNIQLGVNPVCIGKDKYYPSIKITSPLYKEKKIWPSLKREDYDEYVCVIKKQDDGYVCEVGYNLKKHIKVENHTQTSCTALFKTGQLIIPAQALAYIDDLQSLEMFTGEKFTDIVDTEQGAYRINVVWDDKRTLLTIHTL